MKLEEVGKRPTETDKLQKALDELQKALDDSYGLALLVLIQYGPDEARYGARAAGRVADLIAANRELVQRLRREVSEKRDAGDQPTSKTP